jgi:hypothetical protein
VRCAAGGSGRLPAGAAGGRRGGPAARPDRTGATRRSTTAANANRAAELSGPRLPPPVVQVRRPIQNGMWAMMYSTHSSWMASKPDTLPGGALSDTHCSVRNTRAAATSTSACADWISSSPANARHHQRAMPSVCGSAWQASASGATAISSTVSISRATNTTARTRTSATANRASSAKNMPPEDRTRRVRLRSIAPAWAGSRPCPSMAPDSPSARAMAREASSSDRFAARNPTTRRGAMSLTAHEVCTLWWPITMIPPASTIST